MAMNQLDLIEPLMQNDEDRAFLRDILAQRRICATVQFRVGGAEFAVTLAVALRVG